MSGPILGVVIIGRNEGRRLEQCLASVRAGELPCVYVDSGSTDGSPAAAGMAGAIVVTLDLSRPFTAARARNCGLATLKASHSDLALVQFIDGDCQLVPGWLETAAEFLLQHNNLAIVCGRRRERYPDNSIYNRVCDIEWNTPVGEARLCGGDFLGRVSAFDEVGGFRDRLIAGEEPDLCLRLARRGWGVWRLDHDMTRHDAAILSFRQWWRRAVRAGHAFAEVTSLHRDIDFSWHRSVRSALAWTGLLAALLIGALFDPRALLGIVLYPIQVVRIAMRQQHNGKPDYGFAALIVVGKFAETWGIFRFLAGRAGRKPAALIEYK